jgi:serine O-acetyltransferase
MAETDVKQVDRVPVESVPVDAEGLPRVEPRVTGHIGIWQRVREDVQTVFAKDPAARSVGEVVLLYPGLHAVWAHRIAHWLWTHRLVFLARLLSEIVRFLTGIEIHPGARIGRRFFIDHGMGVVIGETAVVGNDVLMYKGVVLGGTTSERVKRHPTIGDDVVLGTDAVVLGNITVGTGAKVGSGSVVVKEVPPFATVVGVPGRVVRLNGKRCTPETLLEHDKLPDPIAQAVDALNCEIVALQNRLTALEGPARLSAPRADHNGNGNEGETSLRPSA